MKTKELLCHIIKHIIHEDFTFISDIKLDEWENLFILSYEQDIDGFIYDSLNPHWDRAFKQTALYVEWTQIVLELMFGNKLQYIKAKGHLEKVFRDEAYIILKGPSLKKYYKNPNVRYCGDIDLLVKDKYASFIQEGFRSLGFSFNKGKETSSHVCFDMEGALSIEVHDQLTTVDWIRTDAFPVEELYERKIPFGDIQGAYELSPEDCLLYLLIHGAKHIVHSSLGIRQLIDITIFIENNDLNWASIMEQLKNIGIYNASQCILSFCQTYLGMSLDMVLEENNPYTEYLLDVLLEDGVFGKSNDKAAKEIMHIYYNQYKTESRLKVLGHLIFKPMEEMKEKYQLLRYLPFLLPVCWLIRSLQLGYRYLANKINPSKNQRQLFIDYMRGA